MNRLASLGVAAIALISGAIGGASGLIVAEHLGWFRGPTGLQGPAGPAGQNGTDVASINSIAGTIVLISAVGEGPFCPAGTYELGTVGGRVALPTKNTYDRDFSRLVEYRLCMIKKA